MDMEGGGRGPPSIYSLNRSKKYPFYSPPPTNSLHYNRHDYLDDDSDDPNEVASDDDSDPYLAGYNPRAGFPRGFTQSDEGFHRYPKRQKLKALVSNYEFAPRNPRLGNFPQEWSENEKFLLLEVWGDRFLQLGRNNLRTEDWIEVAEKVSEMSKIARSEAQCRQVMDVLKRKYKKEKAKGGGKGIKWPHFKKMDMLMKQELGNGGGSSLACGLDSGEYVFMDTKVYLDRANGNDEMRDSPCESEEDEDGEEGVEVRGSVGVKGLRVLAESVMKFGEIYEKIEHSKREQMMELERMKGEFQRDLEVQKKQILERAQAEIAKIRERNGGEEEDGEDSDDGGGSAENISD